MLPDPDLSPASVFLTLFPTSEQNPSFGSSDLNLPTFRPGEAPCFQSSLSNPPNPVDR